VPTAAAGKAWGPAAVDREAAADLVEAAAADLVAVDLVAVDREAVGRVGMAGQEAVGRVGMAGQEVAGRVQVGVRAAARPEKFLVRRRAVSSEPSRPTRNNGLRL